MNSKIDKLAAAILVGGKSTRMGVDKATLKILSKSGEITFARKLADEMEEFDEKYLSINSSSRCRLANFIDIPDIVQDIGPLGGIYAVLSQSKKDYVLFAACDMPKLSKEAIMHLVNSWNGEDMCIAFTKTGRHPLFGIYGKTCIPKIKELINGKSYKPILLMECVNSKLVDMSEYEECLMNINTVDDYKKFMGEPSC